MGLLSAIAGGVGVLGFLQDQSNKKASKKAVQAQVDAANANRALYERIYNQSRADQAPYSTAGQEALQAARVRMGLAPMPAAPAPTGNVAATKEVGGPAGTLPAEPAPAPQASPAMGGGQPDFAAYGAANPDLQAEWQRIQQTGNADGFGNDPNAYYAWHYQQYGQNEGRALPTSGAQPEAPPPAADPNAPPPQYYQEQYAERPADLAAPTFTRSPDMSAPDVGQFFSGEWYKDDPSLGFVRDQALQGVNANFAAAGKLRSGDAAKALQDRAANVANTYYGDAFARRLNLYDRTNDNYRYGQDRADRNFLDDRSYGTNLWNTQQNRQDNIFSEDRGFQANRFDQQNANLFGLINVGQNAAAGTAAAGNVFANASAGQNSNVADARSNAALWNAQNRQNLFGSAARVAGMFAGGGF